MRSTWANLEASLPFGGRSEPTAVVTATTPPADGTAVRPATHLQSPRRSPTAPSSPALC